MALVRHFTATGFVVHQDHVLLHWHPKVRAWLPPGGHIDRNEDPVEAVLREIYEEAGVRAEVVPTEPRFDLDYPTQVQPPFTIMIEDIHDPANGYHQHIDMIYFCRLAGPATPLSVTPPKEGWRWVSRDVLSNGTPLPREGGPDEPPPEDVRLLAEQAFRAVEASGD